MEELGAPTDPGLLERLAATRSTTTRSPRHSFASWPIARTRAGCRSPTRRSPGAATSTPTTTRTGSSSRPTTPRSAPAWTRSTSSRAAPTSLDALPREKVFFLQLADAPQLTMDVLQWSRHYRCFPGQGALPVADFVQRVLAAGYDGPLSLEVFNDVFRQADPRPHRDRRDALAARARERPPAPPAALDGFAFVEIGVERRRPNEAAARARVRPRRAAPHQAGPAVGAGRRAGRRQHSARDPEVVAVAVESADPDASGRARRGAARARVERRRGPGEADLTAVEAPDGTAVFFCGEATGSTTSCAPATRPTPVGITRIDHITLAQPFDAFDEAGLFYRSVLDLQPRESQELAAPDGLVRSRALANDDVRVDPQHPRARRLPQGELQHVAFACEDALATAARCASAASRCCPCPATTTTISRPGSTSTSSR